MKCRRVEQLIECCISKATNIYTVSVILIAFPTATMAAQMLVNVTLYVLFLSCICCSVIHVPILHVSLFQSKRV